MANSSTAGESWLDRIQTAIDTGDRGDWRGSGNFGAYAVAADTGAGSGSGDGGAYAGEHSDPESALAAVAAAPAAPIPLTSALSYRALIALWHRSNLEAAEARAVAVEESIALYSDWRDPLESVRDYVDYLESWSEPFDDWGHYVGSQAIRT